jgi:hypothetical protein
MMDRPNVYTVSEAFDLREAVSRLLADEIISEMRPISV